MHEAAAALRKMSAAAPISHRVESSRTAGNLTIVGLIGAIGAGKSTVAIMMGEMGCAVFDADKAGHEVLQRPDVIRRLQSLLGHDIVNDAGAVDRGKVGAIVFADPAKRRDLEVVVHPAIRDLFESAKQNAMDQHVDILVLEAPVLLEAGWNDACDLLVFVDAPREQRIERLKVRGWTEADLTAREAAQWPNDQKSALAQFVVTNDSSLAACRQQVNLILDQVRPSHVKGVS